MTKEQIARLLGELAPLKQVTVVGESFGAYVVKNVPGYRLDKRQAEAARRFANRHNCDFRFDKSTGNGTFTKRTPS